jgi:hypothetical protein
VGYLSFNSDFIASQSQVTRVSLVSINLENVMQELPAKLPANITQLDLKNTLTYTFPSHFTAFPRLEELWVLAITSLCCSVSSDLLTLVCCTQVPGGQLHLESQRVGRDPDAEEFVSSQSPASKAFEDSRVGLPRLEGTSRRTT